MKKFSHTQSAFDKINVYMEELAETQLMLTKHIEMLNVLAAADTNEFQVAAFMKAVYPITKDMAELQVSRAEEKRARIRAVFESDQDLEASAARSKYALLNALTYVIDHEQQRKDDASAQWDNWTGGRMDTKAEGLNFLMGTLAA
jgi:hypothetical protein